MRFIILLILILILFFLISKKHKISFRKKIKLEEFKSNIVTIRVINLDKSKTRWQTIKKQAFKQKINLSRFPAINGKNLNKEQLVNNKIITKNSNLYRNFKNKKGENGCALSHITIWKEFIKSNDEYLLVLEDDIIFTDNFKQKMEYYVNNAPKNWDIIYLGGSNIIGTKHNDLFIKPINNTRYNMGMYSMLFNKKGCQKYLDLLPLDNSIDKYYIKHFNTHINAFYTNPPLITHDNSLDSERRILNNQPSKAGKIWRNFKQKNITIL